MKRFISGKPNLYFGQMISKGNTEITVFPLDKPNCCFFYSGRYAFAAAMIALGFRSGDKILVPSYNCGAEVDPILYCDLEPVFYRINRDLTIDIDDLFNRITDGVRAVLITHFLGFPQPIDAIKRICIEKGIFFIEDCAHALLSRYKGRPLGSYGDVAFFSIKKTLPVPNGGLLIFNNENFSCSRYRPRPNFLATLFYSAELLNYRTWDQDQIIRETCSRLLNTGAYLSSKTMKRFVAAYRKFFSPQALCLVRPDTVHFIHNLMRWGISTISINIVNNSDFASIVTSRRRNFEYFLDHFSDKGFLTLPFESLPAGVCPLFFPILIENGSIRQALHESLMRSGIVTHTWWNQFHPRVPWTDFADAVYLKERLFGLPIHQDLKLEHLDVIIHQFLKHYNALAGRS